MKRVAVVLGVAAAVASLALAEGKLEPGKARWPVKTSLLVGLADAKPRVVPIEQLLALPRPSDALLATVTDWEGDADGTARLRTAGATGLQEGDIVTTRGYVQLVAFSNDCVSGACTDGDYHVQVTPQRTQRDGALIVEVPDEDFVRDPALKATVAKLRVFLRTQMHVKRDFSVHGTCIVTPPLMEITGQLFFDGTHARGRDPGGGRGKGGHPAATLWELHPVFSMTFVEPTDPSHPKVPC